MIPACPNQARFESCDHCLRFKSRCRGIELRGIRSLNFLFVCVRTQPLLRVPEHSASAFPKVRVRIPACAASEAEAGYPTSRHTPSARPSVADTQRTRKRRSFLAQFAQQQGQQRFPSGAALPLEQQIQRTHIPTRRAAAACATGATAPTAPTAPRRASGTTPPRERRQPGRRADQQRHEHRPGRLTTNRDDRDDGGAPRP